MNKTPTQTKHERESLASLRRQFSTLRHQTGSLNEVERLNIVRVKVGLKPVKEH